MAERLQKGFATNAVQGIVRQAASTCVADPLGTLRTLHETTGDALEVVPGKGFDDEFLFGDQLDDLPQAEPLIEGVLMRHAYSVATGLPWQGRRVEQVKVLYIIGEGAYGLAPRKRAWESARKVAVDPKWFVMIPVGSASA